MTALDDAYDRMAGCSPEYGGGLSNHAPMVAEALDHLGRADAIEPWLDRYVGRLEPAEPATGRVAQLGQPSSYAAWRDALDDELRVEAWSPVAVRWVERLLPGLVAGAAHGWLRTAHAVRALRADTTARRAELARGLAYWASCYDELPGVPSPRGRLNVADALAALPAKHDPAAWLISDAVHALADEPTFPLAVDAVDPRALSVSAITSAVAERVVTAGQVAAIVYVHAITAPSALRSVAPLLDRRGVDDAMAHAWQTVAALVACYPTEGTRPRPVGSLDPDDLVELAVRSGEEHGIKLAAAAVTEAGAGADPVVLHAAHRLIGAMVGAR